MNKFPRILLALIILFISPTIFAATKTVNLMVSYKNVNYAGQIRKAIAINDQIPGPVLHFREGDEVIINVHNQLNKPTSIHWHGILLPWQMDGVEGVSQRGISPGGCFQYKFRLRQAGTYWYHAHAGLQEQQGLYGALVIDPVKNPPWHYTKDYTIVLSDWINTYPDQVFANLKKDGGYYSPHFPLQPSLQKFIHDYRRADREERKQLWSDYKSMQQMRMSIYDISDVAYNAFLLNGQTRCDPWTAQVKVGDVVRLRFIGAGGNTIFRVKIPNTIMQMVHVQGNDIRPYPINDFSIAPGETYDVLVKIDNPCPYIIYAESLDKVGAAYGALLTVPGQWVNYTGVTPFPEPHPVTRNMMKFMMGAMHEGILPAPMMDHEMMDHAGHDMTGMDHEKMGHGKMNHSSHNMAGMDHNMPTEPTIIGDKLCPPDVNYKTSIGTKYEPVIAAVKTNNPDKPVTKTIRMELFGYMDHYIWFINGTPEYNAAPIVLEPNKRYRFVFTNTSMMNHPMHLHGHWFILRKGNDEYDPLLHTINVPPGSTITADVDTDASGQWFFHCHMLYHMMAGMARVFQYSTLIELSRGKIAPENIVGKTGYYNRPIVRVDEVLPLDPGLIRHPMGHSAGFWFASFLDIGIDPFRNIPSMTFKGLYGPDYNKLELFMNDAELNDGKVEDADLDIFYWHLLNQFWAIKGGVNYYYRPAIRPYWQPGIGIEGLMPYFIETDVRGYLYSGSAKLDIELSRDTQITNNFFIGLGIRSILATKSVERAQIGSGLNQMRYIIRPFYRLVPGINIFIEYEYQKNYGAFRDMQLAQGDSATESTLTFGLSAVF